MIKKVLCSNCTSVGYERVYTADMKCFFIVIVFVFSVVTSLPLHADKLSIDALTDYLDGLRTVHSKFTQINSDGTLSTGSLYIKRPGRIRFEYDPPNQALVLASAGQLAIFDPNGNSTPESYPLSKSPLALILAEKVELAQNKMVKSHRFDGGSTILTVHDPQHPEQGLMELVFTGPKPQLRQWVIENQNEEKTVVILNNMVIDIKLTNS